MGLDQVGTPPINAVNHLYTELPTQDNNNNNSGHLLCAGIRPKTLMAQAITITLSRLQDYQNYKSRSM